jgi:hypothetical protein
MTGIATTDPIPKQSNNNPNAASSTPVLDLANGIMGAQEAKTSPLAINATRVALAAERNDIADDMRFVHSKKSARRYPSESKKVND